MMDGIPPPNSKRTTTPTASRPNFSGLVPPHFYRDLAARLTAELAYGPCRRLLPTEELSPLGPPSPGHIRIFTGQRLDSAVEKVPDFIIKDAPIFHARDILPGRNDTNDCSPSPSPSRYDTFEARDSGTGERTRLTIITFYDIPLSDFEKYATSLLGNLINPTVLFDFLTAKNRLGPAPIDLLEKLRGFSASNNRRIEILRKKDIKVDVVCWEQRVERVVLHEIAESLWPILSGELKGEWKGEVLPAGLESNDDNIYFFRLLQHLSLGEDLAKESFCDKLALFFLGSPFPLRHFGLYATEREAAFFQKVIGYLQQRKAERGQIFSLA